MKNAKVEKLAKVSKSGQKLAKVEKVLSPAAQIYHARRAAGVCVKCGAPTAENSNLLCPSHLEYYNSWHAAKNAKIAQALALLEKSAAKK